MASEEFIKTKKTYGALLGTIYYTRCRENGLVRYVLASKPSCRPISRTQIGGLYVRLAFRQNQSTTLQTLQLHRLCSGPVVKYLAKVGLIAQAVY